MPDLQDFACIGAVMPADSRADVWSACKKSLQCPYIRLLRKHNWLRVTLLLDVRANDDSLRWPERAGLLVEGLSCKSRWSCQ